MGLYEEQRQRLKERTERSRSVRVNLSEETGELGPQGEPVILIERSEKHLHEGHEYEHYESLSDNAIEGTTWYYCQTCKAEGRDPEFWWASVEIESGL